MDKKTGILTFHRALSYGAVLQAYALQSFLFKNNIDNEIVDYKCDYMIEHYQKIIRKTNGNPVKGLVWSLLNAGDVVKSKRLMKAFVEENLKISNFYDKATVSQTVDSYKNFVCGSDQVWSPECVGFDPVYFLTFAKPCQKYSYAASIAVSEIPADIKQEFTKRISDFSGYSVRENSGKKIVRELTGKEAQVHIDPTLLLKKYDWDKLACENEMKEPYIFMFTVLKHKKLVDYALELSRKTGLKVLFLNSKKPHSAKGVTYLDPVSPERFISLIKNAEYVCTNSFHGTAFSVIYQKNFVVETETVGKKNIRSQELLTALGLESRILSPEHKPDINEKSDWERAEAWLKRERESSRKYLLSLKD